MLKEGVSNHRHECMTMEALPGPALEVVETEFLFELLVGLLANPSRLDGRRQNAQEGLRRQALQSDVLPAMVGSSKSRPPMNH